MSNIKDFEADFAYVATTYLKGQLSLLDLLGWEAAQCLDETVPLDLRERLDLLALRGGSVVDGETSEADFREFIRQLIPGQQIVEMTVGSGAGQPTTWQSGATTKTEFIPAQSA